MTDTEHFIVWETFVQNVSLRDFTMLCIKAEYKRMGQDLSLGQLYDVQNKIEIYIKHWLGLFIYYNTNEFIKQKINCLSFYLGTEWKDTRLSGFREVTMPALLLRLLQQLSVIVKK